MKENDETVLLEINCPGKGQVLSILRNFICSVAEEMGFGNEDIAQIEMSVDEACSNIVCHAYSEIREKKGTVKVKKSQIKLVIKAARDHLNIIISDTGVGNRTGPHKGVNNIQEFVNSGHGLGTFIINKFMDKVDVYYPEDAGTTVSMVKYISR
jgi:serine/threonine-protein kinase RsbW